MAYELKTLEQFRLVKSNSSGYFVIEDKYNQEDDKIHIPGCRTVTEDGFQKKVLENNNKTGHYYYVDNIEEAKTTFKARECKLCWG